MQVSVLVNHGLDGAEAEHLARGELDGSGEDDRHGASLLSK
jgi:hypothetical protein